MTNEEDKKLIVSNVSKKFNIGFYKQDSALSRFLTLVFSRESKHLITVLEDISFSVAKGEKIGIIGDNGSGKSTLLRIIAGIYQADAGKVECQGDPIYMNGFGIGMKPRLSMRSNIYLIGAVMGLKRKEIRARFQDIVDFSGLSEYVDTKVYQFSSGMLSRLRFSATMFSLKEKRPEVLLLDEVLGTGGDNDFKIKALKKIEEFLKEGSAVLLVSHEMQLIEKYCDKVILIEKGRIRKIGHPKEIVNLYLNS